MIKNYKQFESLLDKMKGPTYEEAWDSVKDLDLPADKLFSKFIKASYYDGIIKLLDEGYDKFYGSYFNTVSILNILKEFNDIDRIKEIINKSKNDDVENFQLRLACATDIIEIFDIYYQDNLNLFDTIVNICLNEDSLKVLEHYFDILKHKDYSNVSSAYGYKHWISSLEAKIRSHINIMNSNREIHLIGKLGELLKRVSDKINESLLDNLKGPSDDEITNHYIENKKYTKLLYFAMRRYKFDLAEFALKNGADISNILDEIYDNEFRLTDFKKIIDILDFDSFNNREIWDFFFKLDLYYRGAIIDKIQNNDNLKSILLKNLSYTNNYNTIGLFFEKGLSDNLIIYFIEQIYNNININLFEYVFDNFKIPIHFKDDQLLYYVVFTKRYYRNNVIKILLDNGANIYAKNNSIIEQIKSEKNNTLVYNLFKEKDFKNILED